jgi:acyl-CoA thioester hydrolase
MDSYGHVNNVQFLRLLEEARVAMLFVEPKAADVMTLDGQLVVVRHEIDYTAPLLYRPEPIEIETWVTRIGGASFTVAYEVKDGDQVYARARTVLAAIAKDTGRARRISAEERSWIEAYYEPEDVEVK